MQASLEIKYIEKLGLHIIYEDMSSQIFVNIQLLLGLCCS